MNGDDGKTDKLGSIWPNVNKSDVIAPKRREKTDITHNAITLNEEFNANHIIGKFVDNIHKGDMHT